MPTLFTRRFALSLAMSAALAGCSKSEAPAAAASGTPAAAADKGMVVATNAAFAPFESLSSSGQVEGFDADVIKAVADKAGFKIRFVNTPWEGIFNTLNSGESDIVMSAVTITDVRKQSMEFSEPYFDAVQLIAVPQDSKVASLEDIKALTIGVQNGTTGDEVVSKLIGKTNPNIKRFESMPLALKELEAGGLQAVVGDNGVVRHYIQNNSGSKFKLVNDQSFTPERYGIVIRKGNTELLKKVNDGLSGIRQDGSYTTIYSKWFGAPEAAPAAAAASAPASAAASAASH